jgi:hypothetical protein
MVVMLVMLVVLSTERQSAFAPFRLEDLENLRGD